MLLGLPGRTLEAASGRAWLAAARDRPAEPLLGRGEGGPQASGRSGRRRRSPGRPVGPGEHPQPVPLTYMIISRDVMLIAAVFYVRYRTLPTPRTLAKYFNPCYATARLKPTFISKVNTAVQLILVAASLAAPVFNYADSIYLQILWCFTAFTTAASAYSYYHYGRKTVQVIKD
ncbi:cardiolipin synthase (CMP-forming) isoform X7 [Macaca fascicularis]|uniref:cardiolipin synthase (CMP-forming) isoform X7 n=1 Tax=Macaca fascicularis TaxID=9541 RepID=UPI003D15A6DA